MTTKIVKNDKENKVKTGQFLKLYFVYLQNMKNINDKKSVTQNNEYSVINKFISQIK